MKLTPEMIEAAADELRRIKADGLNPASYIAAQSALNAAIAAIEAAGYVIAPKEPTPEMVERQFLALSAPTAMMARACMQTSIVP